MKNIFLVAAILLFTQKYTSEPCDCVDEDYEPECGRNGKTYFSGCHRECDLVEKAHDGSCKHPCEECPLVIQPVCGADGITYNNSCEATCNRTYAVLDGPCGGCNCRGQALNPICSTTGRTYENAC